MILFVVMVFIVVIFVGVTLVTSLVIHPDCDNVPILQIFWLINGTHGSSEVTLLIVKLLRSETSPLGIFNKMKSHNVNLPPQKILIFCPKKLNAIL